MKAIPATKNAIRYHSFGMVAVKEYWKVVDVFAVPATRCGTVALGIWLATATQHRGAEVQRRTVMRAPQPTVALCAFHINR
jgi:hypothetical protein